MVKKADPFDPLSISAKPKTKAERRRLNMMSARRAEVAQGKHKHKQTHPWIQAMANRKKGRRTDDDAN